MLTSLRSSLRSLRKAPAFTALSIATLAVGLGANTAIFSVAYTVLVQPLPFPESARLVSVRAMVKRETWERRAFSHPDFRDYHAQATAAFAGLAALESINVNLATDGGSSRIFGYRVSADYFAVLGARPALGRVFTADDDRAPGLAPLVVLSDSFWRTHFAGAADVVGRSLRLSDVEYTVIGVMPPGFHGLDGDTQLWVPMSTVDAAQWNARGNRGREAIGRLKPGITLEQARAELAAIGLRLAAEHPQTNANYSADLAPLREELFGDLRQPLFVLLAAVGLLLVITCVNVANLLLVRLAHRRREIAVRLSLGAGRGELARLFLGESLLLAAAGGALGALLAAWFVALLARVAPVNLPAFVRLDLHWPAFAFAAAVALLCALAIGALPALFAGKVEVGAALKDAGRTGHSGAAGARVRAGLVTAEIALSLALLVAAALFGRSFVNLVTQTPGYRTERLVTQRVLLPPGRYHRETQLQFARTLLERAAALPGVRAVALATDTPLDGNSSALMYTVDGGSPAPAENEGRTYAHVVTPDFFLAAGIALRAGQTFAPRYEAGTEPVAIVSESLARRFWPAGGAVGQRLKPGRSGSQAPWVRIIGVAAETKYRGLVANPTGDPDIYFPFDQRPTGSFALVVHTAGESRAIGQSLRQLVTSLDPTVTVFGLTTIEDRIANASASQRFSAQLMGTFALLALLLATLGLYGVVSFSVAQRTQEIGVRMALGARPLDIARMVIAGTGRLVALGLLLGTGLAYGLTRFIGTLLYDVETNDPAAYLIVAGVLSVVALAACLVPARRAAQVDPLVALRSE